MDAGKFRSNSGDWICSDPNCKNLNFARRSSCHRCNKEKEIIPSKKKVGQEIGKTGAEKSKGLFSADDWLCSKCCNINWARRQNCNMCSAPRYGEVEERTGYGGGYNDRGVVEYVKRTDSDDEYDEFGRRKKKGGSKRSNSYTSEDEDRSSQKSEARRTSFEEKVQYRYEKNGADCSDEDELLNEEDEDEDDAEDLSKYDLSEWDDLAAENKLQKSRDADRRSNDEGRRSTKRRSRSRSPNYL